MNFVHKNTQHGSGFFDFLFPDFTKPIREKAAQEGKYIAPIFNQSPATFMKPVVPIIGKVLDPFTAGTASKITTGMSAANTITGGKRRKTKKNTRRSY